MALLYNSYSELFKTISGWVAKKKVWPELIEYAYEQDLSPLDTKICGLFLDDTDEIYWMRDFEGVRALIAALDRGEIDITPYLGPHGLALFRALIERKR